MSPFWKEEVFVGGIGNVSDKQQHVLVILPAPLGVELGQHGSRIDVVSEVVVVVVVEAGSEVLASIRQRWTVRILVPATSVAVFVIIVAAAHHDASPIVIVEQWRLSRSVNPNFHSGSKSTMN